MLYFAYGMNTNRHSMAGRCPNARALGAAHLLGHRFRFAHHADVQVDRKCLVHGVLWSITESCLESLDQLEGYPFYYNRKWAQIEHDKKHCQALVYFMQPGHRSSAPSMSYFETVREGYQEFAVPQQQLWQARQHYRGQ
jgi:gamma-glutamylcyclotransferase (GGCT)/AIG2-like uncharacterized protein YtfP